MGAAFTASVEIPARESALARRKKRLLIIVLVRQVACADCKCSPHYRHKAIAVVGTRDIGRVLKQSLTRDAERASSNAVADIEGISNASSTRTQEVSVVGVRHKF